MPSAVPHILDLSPETQALVERLAATSIGETVPFDTLSEALGRDIKRRRHVLASALRVCLRDRGILFASVRGVGYQRIPAEEAHTVGARTREKVRRSAHRGAKQISQAIRGANDLSADALKRAYAEQASLSLIEHLARDTSQPAEKDMPARPEPVAVTARSMLQRLAQ